MTQRLRYVTVEHDENRLLPREMVGEPATDAFRKGKQALVRRHAGPPQRECNLVVAVLKIERDNMVADRSREFFRSMASPASNGGCKTWRLRRGSNVPGAEM